MRENPTATVAGKIHDAEVVNKEICQPSHASWGHVQLGVLVKENLPAELLLYQLAPQPDAPRTFLGQTTACRALPWLQEQQLDQAVSKHKNLISQTFLSAQPIMHYTKICSWLIDVVHNVMYRHHCTLKENNSTKWICRDISLMYRQFETQAWFCSSPMLIPEIVCQLLYIWKKTKQNRTTPSTFAYLLSSCGLLPCC